MIQRQEQLGPWILAAAVIHAFILAATPMVYFSMAQQRVQEMRQQQPPQKVYDEPLDRRTVKP